MCLIWVSKIKGTTTHQVSLSRARRISQYSRVSTIGRILPARSVVRIAQARSCVDASRNRNPITSPLEHCLFPEG